MKKFIIKIIIFSIIGLTLVLSMCYKIDGYSDSFYVKFTTQRQTSLLLGTSRAAQGLQPSVFESVLNKRFFNYAFSVFHSPYGKTYLNSIQKKLDTTRNGIFVLAVDPWSLSSLTKNPEDSLSFRETNLALKKTNFVNIKPNLFYLMNNRNERFYDLIIDKQSTSFLHEDGWLEINLPIDSLKFDENVEKKIEKYKRDMLPKAQFSQTRYNYLKQTINFLNRYGDVYLVRLPIHQRMMNLDSILMPHFNENIKEAIQLSGGYLDLTPLNSNFYYTDGNHLHKTSGKIVSEIIANWVNKTRQVKNKI